MKYENSNAERNIFRSIEFLVDQKVQYDFLLFIQDFWCQSIVHYHMEKAQGYLIYLQLQTAMHNKLNIENSISNVLIFYTCKVATKNLFKYKISVETYNF